MKIDVTKCQEEKILDNLILLHTRLCEEGGNVYDVIELTKYLKKLLKSKGKEFIYGGQRPAERV